MSDTVLVTGATGFLGHHLVPYLVACGYRVNALVRETSDTRHLRDPNVHIFIGDVLNQDSVQKAVAGCRYVVHAAGLFRFWGKAADFERVNVEGTAYVLETARRSGVEKLAHISTVAVVGQHDNSLEIDEDVQCQPADPYQRSKLDAENFVRMFARGAGMPGVILRPGAFYGPWGRYAFNRLFFEDPLKGLLIQVQRGERITFPAFAPDVARAVVAALREGQSGETYNICGEPLPQSDANAIVSRLAGLPSFRLNVPADWMLRVADYLTHRAERTGREPYYPTHLASYVFQDWRVCSQKAKDDLGFAPTPFEEGARQTLEWYWSQKLFRRPRRAPRALPMRRADSIPEPLPAKRG
ncbi:MAG: NAD-dependent epimerase/dehydratase family protein [Anaerolineales bacterium]